MLKLCCKCKTEKPLSQFSKRSAAKDGLYSSCKDCESARVAEWYSKNSEKQKQAAAKYYAENKQACLATQAVYRDRHREKIGAQISAYRKTPEGKRKKTEHDRAYVAASPDKVAVYGKRYRQGNKEKVAAHVQARRAARLQAINNQDTELLAFASQEANRLAKLRSSITGRPWELDHIVPLRGDCVSGLHNPANFQVIPRAVNRRKSKKFDGSVAIAITML